MRASDVVEDIVLTGWSEPVPPAAQARAIAALEGGRVLVLPGLAFALDDAERGALDPGRLAADRKNISYDPATGRCSGHDPDGRLAAVLRRFGDGAERLVRALLPAYGAGLERARASFRPAEIVGRSYSPRHDDRRLHVDAFPSRPTQGRRILRVFSNVAADGTAREWLVGEPFEDFARTFLPRLRGMWPGQAWAMATLGLTKSRRSAYDHCMLGLHDAAKLDALWQQSTARVKLHFTPGTTWVCFTDQVLHAATAGHSAFEQTFHVGVDVMRAPGSSPLRVLETLTGRALV